MQCLALDSRFGGICREIPFTNAKRSEKSLRMPAQAEHCKIPLYLTSNHLWFARRRLLSASSSADSGSWFTVPFDLGKAGKERPKPLRDGGRTLVVSGRAPPPRGGQSRSGTGTLRRRGETQNKSSHVVTGRGLNSHSHGCVVVVIARARPWARRCLRTRWTTRTRRRP